MKLRALDSDAETSIQTALERIMDGKTLLTIAHRLSTITRMDRIIVVNKGEILEAGKHKELLALKGLYARYWNCQYSGYIGSKEADE